MTLIELLVAMFCSVFVLAAGVSFLVVIFHQQNEISSRDVAKGAAENGLDQLVLDLRDAASQPTISVSGSTTTLSFSIPVPGNGGVTSEAVTWTCVASTSSPGTCTRVTGSGVTAATRTEISGVESLTVTPYGSSGASLSLPTNGTTTVSAVGLQLAVQDSSYGLTARAGTAEPAVAGSKPIDFDVLADLRNSA